MKTNVNACLAVLLVAANTVGVASADETLTTPNTLKGTASALTWGDERLTAGTGLGE